jgi:hypothetical protein
LVAQKEEEEKRNRTAQEAEAALLAGVEEEVRQKALLEGQLRSRLEEYRSLEQAALTAQGRENATVALLEDRLRAAKETLRSKSGDMFALREVVVEAEREKGVLVGRQTVLERLGEAFGPRGVQHYVFMGVVRQLEDIANGRWEGCVVFYSSVAMCLCCFVCTCVCDEDACLCVF